MHSCVPYFGLSKGNSNLVRFDVQTSGPVQGVPVIGSNLTPVLTLTDATHASISCTLDARSLAWTSQPTFFSDYLQGNDPFAYEYPGSSDFYETPFLGFPLTVGGQAFTPVSASIAVHTSLPGVTVSLSSTTPEDLNHSYFNGPGSSLTSPTDPVVAYSVQRMLNVGGSQGAANMLAKLQVTNTCTAGAAALASYNAHIGQLYSGASSPAANCQEAVNNLSWAFVYYSSLLPLQVQGAPVTVTVSAPEPTTTALPPTTLTPSPSLAATGSSAGALLGGAGILAGLGALLVAQGRRLRRRHQG